MDRKCQMRMQASRHCRIILPRTRNSEAFRSIHPYRSSPQTKHHGRKPMDPWLQGQQNGSQAHPRGTHHERKCMMSPTWLRSTAATQSSGASPSSASYKALVMGLKRRMAAQSRLVSESFAILKLVSGHSPLLCFIQPQEGSTQRPQLAATSCRRPQLLALPPRCYPKNPFPLATHL